MSVWLCDLLDASYLIPVLESVLQNGTVFPSTQAVSSRLEMTRDRAKSRKKALCLFG